MSKRTLKSVLIISLAFNLAVAAVVVHGLALRERACAPPAAPAAAARIPLAEHGRQLSRCLGLSGQSAARFEEVMSASNAEAKAVKREIESARGDLFRLLEQRGVEEQQLMAEVERISVLQGRLEKLLVKRLIDSRSVLRPEEDARLMNMIRCSLRTECLPAERCPHQNGFKDGSGDGSGN